jgi:hypothetical protein
MRLFVRHRMCEEVGMAKITSFRDLLVWQKSTFTTSGFQRLE